MIAYADKLRSGYAQTKWVAEQLVMRAHDRGLPAAVYRYLCFLLHDATKLYRLAALRQRN
jgi:thioester reductase-like protein